MFSLQGEIVDRNDVYVRVCGGGRRTYLVNLFDRTMDKGVVRVAKKYWRILSGGYYVGGNIVHTSPPHVVLCVAVGFRFGECCEEQIRSARPKRHVVRFAGDGGVDAGSGDVLFYVIL